MAANNHKDSFFQPSWNIYHTNFDKSCLDIISNAFEFIGYGVFSFDTNGKVGLCPTWHFQTFNQSMLAAVDKKANTAARP